MKNFKFGIVTSFYNCENYIDDCIKSLLNQTYKNWIWFITDDGSSDNTKNKIFEYCKQYNNLIYFNQKYPMQMLKNPQAFVSKDCDYMVIMDSDDFLLPKCLEIYNKYLNKYENENIVFMTCEAAWSYNNYESFNHASYLYSLTELDQKTDKYKKGANVWGNFRCFKNNQNLQFFDKDYICSGKINGFVPDDLIQYTYMQKFGNFLNIKRNLYKFRRRGDSFSNPGKYNIDEYFFNRLNKIKNNENLQAKSIRTWENDLFDDCNSLLLSNFNYEEKRCKINLYTDEKEKDFINLYELYEDHDLKINSLDDSYEYVIINKTNIDDKKFIDLINFIKNKNLKELYIYFNTFDNEKLLKNHFDLINQNINANIFWCCYGRFCIHRVTF